MTEPKITYVRFTAPMPLPATTTRAFGSRKELRADEVEGPIRAAQHGVIYSHPQIGTVLVPWTSVHHCCVETAAPPKKASAAPKPAPSSEPDPAESAVPTKKRRGRPPKAKPSEASA